MSQKFNENSIRILNNIKENLEEILTIDNMAQLKYKYDTMFHYFYELEISGQAHTPSILKLAEEQLKTLIFQNADKFLYYFIDFIEFVSRTNRDGRELERLDICQTRSGIQCFIDMFGPCFEKNEDLRLLTREEDSFIEELDKRIKIWHKYFGLTALQINQSINKSFTSVSSSEDDVRDVLIGARENEKDLSMKSAFIHLDAPQNNYNC